MKREEPYQDSTRRTPFSGYALQGVEGGTTYYGLMAKLVRTMRRNPDASCGHGVILFLAIMLARSSRNLGPPREGEQVPANEVLEWTPTVLIALLSQACDLAPHDPQVSDDAKWALAAVGLTPEDVRTGLNSSSDMSRLVARALRHFPEVLEVD